MGWTYLVDFLVLESYPSQHTVLFGHECIYAAHVVDGVVADCQKFLELQAQSLTWRCQHIPFLNPS